jgi:hypothetical protein
MNVHEHHDETRDDISDGDVDIEEGPFDISDRQHAQVVSVLVGNFGQVVVNVDGDEDGACEDGDTGEEPTEEVQET